MTKLNNTCTGRSANITMHNTKNPQPVEKDNAIMLWDFAGHTDRKIDAKNQFTIKDYRNNFID